MSSGVKRAGRPPKFRLNFERAREAVDGAIDVRPAPAGLGPAGAEVRVSVPHALMDDERFRGAMGWAMDKPTETVRGTFQRQCSRQAWVLKFENRRDEGALILWCTGDIVADAASSAGAGGGLSPVVRAGAGRHGGFGYSVDTDTDSATVISTGAASAGTSSAGSSAGEPEAEVPAWSERSGSFDSVGASGDECARPTSFGGRLKRQRSRAGEADSEDADGAAVSSLAARVRLSGGGGDGGGATPPGVGAGAGTGLSAVDLRKLAALASSYGAAKPVPPPRAVPVAPTGAGYEPAGTASAEAVPVPPLPVPSLPVALPVSGLGSAADMPAGAVPVAQRAFGVPDAAARGVAVARVAPPALTRATSTTSVASVDDRAYWANIEAELQRVPPPESDSVVSAAAAAAAPAFGAAGGAGGAGAGAGAGAGMGMAVDDARALANAVPSLDKPGAASHMGAEAAKEALAKSDVNLDFGASLASLDLTPEEQHRLLADYSMDGARYGMPTSPGVGGVAYADSGGGWLPDDAYVFDASSSSSAPVRARRGPPPAVPPRAGARAAPKPAEAASASGSAKGALVAVAGVAAAAVVAAAGSNATAAKLLGVATPMVKGLVEMFSGLSL